MNQTCEIVINEEYTDDGGIVVVPRQVNLGRVLFRVIGEPYLQSQLLWEDEFLETYERRYPEGMACDVLEQPRDRILKEVYLDQVSLGNEL